MTVAYSRRALLDLEEVAGFYSTAADPRIAERFLSRLEAVLVRVERRPESARVVAQRPGVRVAPLITFPYLVFFRAVGPGHIRILHVRHSARQPQT